MINECQEKHMDYLPLTPSSPTGSCALIQLGNYLYDSYYSKIFNSHIVNVLWNLEGNMADKTLKNKVKW